MKRLLLFSLICLCACESTQFEDSSSDSVVSNEYNIPLEEALTHLDSFLSEMNAETKSSGIYRDYSCSSIETISTSDLFIDTKSSPLNETITGDLMYIVNFDNDLGTAVLSADERTSDVVLCVTESGSLNFTDFAKANEFMQSENNVMVNEEDDFMIDLGELTIPSMVLSSVISEIYNYDYQQQSAVTKSLSSAHKYGPYLTTKWCQKKLAGSNELLFNRYTPNNYAAGCVVIAVAQVLMNVINFTFTCSDGHVCQRDTMMTVAHYLTPYYAGTSEAQVQAGKFVYNLGASSLLCDVSYGKNGSSSNANKAKRTFDAFLLRNVDKKTGFNDTDENNVTNQVRAGRPVYMGGLKKGSVYGHAWVVDGEWGDYYHINWGWNGMYDGYFSKGTFKPQGGRASYIDAVDSGTYGSYTNETLKPYTWSYKYITYDL